jgi:hypothetical protein
VRLDRPERVRGDRRADWPSHGSSSISQPWRRRRVRSMGDRRQTDQRTLGHGHANWGAAFILAEGGLEPDSTHSAGITGRN